MAVKVHGMGLSTCTSRVLACCLEKEVEYELVHVDLSSGAHKQPDFLSKNPFGQIPVLEDGGVTIFESRAITVFLSNKYAEQGADLLRKGNLNERGVVVNWIEVESQHYNPAISPIVYQLLILPKYGKQPDEEVIKASVEKFEKVLDVYEARLTNTKYLAGDFFSLADLNHFPFTFYLMKTKYADLINSRPHVKAWWEAVSSRPSFKKVAENMTMG